MTLPLRSAGIGGRQGAAILPLSLGFWVLIGLLLPLAAASADTSDRYSATVKVDATADNVADAREQARLGGERRALTQVVAGLSGGVGDPKLAKLGDRAITDLVSSFAVANERMSAVRYLADYTFHFNPAGVRRLLQGDGVAIVLPGGGGAGGAPAGGSALAGGGMGKPIVVLPVYDTAGGDVLWGDPNPWRAAWAARPPELAAPGSARLVVPSGDPGDVAAIDAQKARAGDSAALAAIARKDGADTVVVAQARLRGDDPDGPPTGLDIFLQRYRGGELVDSESNSLDAAPGESTNGLLSQAVAASVSALAGGSTANAAPSGAPAGPQASVTVTVPITSLADWVRLRGELTAMPAIRRVDLMSLTLTEAEIAIDYTGSIDQLTASLAAANLNLVPGSPVGQLQRSGVTSAR